MKTPGSLKIASFRGVDLNIHVSLLFLLLYIVFVAAAQFPLIVESSGVDINQIAWSPAAWGLLFAFGIFASVALHEFGHAIVAQSMGVEVRGITLMMLGGVSEMGKMPEGRYSEFKLAVAGPIVSLALAGVLWMLRSYVPLPELALYGYWLGSANLVLAIFNLLPVFPMDGGRALRSLLAVRQGQLKATRVAVSVSRFFSVLFGIVGFLTFNILLLLIAFFVWSGAKTELMFLESRGLLQGVKAGEITFRVDPVGDMQLVSVAADQMIKYKTGVLPVETDLGEPAVITLNHLRRIPQERWDLTRVRDVRQEVPKALDVQDSIEDALVDLARSGAGALPVRENGRLIGLIRANELTDTLQFKSLERATQEEEELRRKMIWFCLSSTDELAKIVPLLHQADQSRVPWRIIHFGKSDPRWNEQWAEFRLPFERMGRIPARELALPIRRLEASILRSLDRLPIPVKDSWCVIGGSPIAWLAARAGRRTGLKVVHLEAGLSSGQGLNAPFEDYFRRLTSRSSTLLVVPDPDSASKLRLRQGRKRKMIEISHSTLSSVPGLISSDPGIFPSLAPDGYGVARISRTGNLLPRRFDRIMRILSTAAAPLPLLIWIDPKVEEELTPTQLDRLRFTGARVASTPLFAARVGTMRQAQFVASDSSDDQVICSALGTPCLILRRWTEWYSGLGANCVLSFLDIRISELFLRAPAHYRRPPKTPQKRDVLRILEELRHEIAPGPGPAEDQPRQHRATLRERSSHAIRRFMESVLKGPQKRSQRGQYLERSGRTSVLHHAGDFPSHDPAAFPASLRPDRECRPGDHGRAPTGPS